MEMASDTTGNAKVVSASLVGRCRVTATGKEHEAAFASRLASVLLNDRAYQGIGDLCIFHPSVALRSWRGREQVDTVTCLHCGDIILAVTDDAGKSASEAEARFYTIDPQLASLLKEAFPTDQQMQGLPIGQSLSAAQFAKRAYPVLIVASRRGYAGVVRTALSKGANPNMVFDTETPLGMAISGGHLEIVKVLVTEGASVSVRSAGSTPLEQARQARQGRNGEIVPFLLARGAKE